MPFVDEINALLPGMALDIASGDGEMCMYLAQLGWVCEGIDPVPDAVALARMRAEQHNLTAVLNYSADFWLDYQPKREAYDLVADLGALSAYPQSMHAAYLQKVHDVLRPQGLFVAYVHFDALIATREEQFTPARLAASLKSGFDVIVSLSATVTASQGARPAVWLLLRKR